MASCRRAGRKREEEGGRGKKMKKIREKSVELPRLFYSPFYSSSGWLLAGSTLGTRRFSLSAGICEKLSVSLSLSLSLSLRPAEVQASETTVSFRGSAGFMGGRWRPGKHAVEKLVFHREILLLHPFQA